MDRGRILLKESKNVGLVIPVYNVGTHLPDVLTKCLKYIDPSKIYVIDDGCTDGSIDLIQSFQVQIIRHEENMGKGVALKTGFQKAIEDKLDAVITLDGDGQHDPDSIPDFIDVYTQTKAHVIMGKRSFKPDHMPLDRIFSNVMSSLFTSELCGQWIPDSQCGFRLIQTQVLKKIPLKTNHYEMETEILIKAVRHGYKLESCPIHITYGESVSHINRIRDSLRFIKLLIRLVLE